MRYLWVCVTVYLPTVRLIFGGLSASSHHLLLTRQRDQNLFVQYRIASDELALTQADHGHWYVGLSWVLYHILIDGES